MSREVGERERQGCPLFLSGDGCGEDHPQGEDGATDDEFCAQTEESAGGGGGYVIDDEIRPGGRSTEQQDGAGDDSSQRGIHGAVALVDRSVRSMLVRRTTLPQDES